MQAITVEFIQTFISSNDIPFSATQPKLCVPIIFRMCQKMSHGLKFDEIKVCDNLVIDGHHRYLSALIMKFEIGKIPSNKTSATKIFLWDEVQFDENDWDTPAKIAHLNELDAKYNDMGIEFVKQIINR